MNNSISNDHLKVSFSLNVIILVLVFLQGAHYLGFAFDQKDFLIMLLALIKK